MAITFRSAISSQATSDTGRNTSEPAGVVEDDFMIAVAWIDNEDGTWNIPTDWTRIEHHTQDVAGGHIAVYHVVRGASEPTGMNFDYSGTAGEVRVTIYAFTSVDTTTSLDIPYVTADHYDQGNNQPLFANKPITTDTNNAMLVLLDVMEFSGSGTPGAPSTPSGLTMESTGDGAKPQQLMAYGVQASSGTVTPTDWTHTGFDGNDDPIVITLALRAATSGPVITDVNTTETWDDGDTGLVITGTGFV